MTYRILHLSDFHITSQTPQEDIDKLNKMTDFLDNQNKKINCIVFTGDAIDKNVIKEEMTKITNDSGNGVTPEVNEHDLIQSAYLKAIGALKAVSTKLNVLPSNVISVCGNHDIDRLGQTINQSGDSSKNFKENDENKMSQSFKNFDFFTKQIGSNMDHHTNIYSVDGFNFLCINTNFSSADEAYCKQSKKKEQCINCYGVQNIIKANYEKLKNNGRSKNIILSHAPAHKFCEHVLLPPTGVANSVSPIDNVTDLCELHLCGDKHRTARIGTQFYAGTPLREKYIGYNLFEFSESGSYNCRLLIYEKDNWTFSTSPDEISDILAASFGVKTKGVFEIFNWTYDESCLIKKEFFSRELSSNIFDDVDAFFKHIATLNRVVENRSSERIPWNGNILDHITSLITKSTCSNPVTFKGSPQLGKSMLASFYYIYLLNEFIQKRIGYLPIYINVRKIMDTNSDKQIEKIETYLNNATLLVKIHDVPLIMIIDGLSRYTYHDENRDISNKIFDVVSKYTSKTKNKCVYVIDTEKNLKFARSKIEQMHQQNAEWIIDFSSIIETGKSSENEGLTGFLVAYQQLFIAESKKVVFKEFIDRFTKEIDNYSSIAIDIDLVMRFNDYFNSYSKEMSLTSVYEKYLADKVQNTNRYDRIYKAAYLLKRSSSLLTFNKLHTQTKINSEEFEILKEQRYLRSLGFAKYYISNIKKYIKYQSNHNNKHYINAINVLNSLFNKSEALFIINYIKTGQLLQEFLDYFDLIINDEHYDAQALAIYVLGRIKEIDAQRRNSLLDKAKKALDDNHKEDNYKKTNAYRSYYISKIVANPESHLMVNAYLDMLFSAKEQRVINRTANRHFYGDTQNMGDTFEDPMDQSFDFYKTYYHFNNDIVKRFKKEHSIKHPFLALKLFTICDLIQTKLEKYSIVDPKNFYTKRYGDNPETVLNHVVELINDYLKSPPLGIHSFLSDYFKSFQNMVNLFLTMITAGTFQDIGVIFNDSKIINNVQSIFGLDHIKWKTNAEPACVVLSKKIETVADHILATYYIGLLYLPKKSDNKDYRKQKVLDILLLHDISKSGSEKDADQQYMRTLFMERCRDAVITDNLYNCYKLWDDWVTNTSDINAIIAQEIEAIQTIFEFYRTAMNNGGVPLCKKQIISTIVRSIRTQISKNIYKHVVSNNQQFKNLINDET